MGAADPERVEGEGANVRESIRDECCILLGKMSQISQVELFDSGETLSSRERLGHVRQIRKLECKRNEVRVKREHPELILLLRLSVEFVSSLFCDTQLPKVREMGRCEFLVE